ncbi:MAG: hypothetical protein KKD38_09515 [Candidatus Delongbacteria bacterium]|nr:hypothetical protein [Candidatus Delongbacteria bacterium]MCG2759649.1 hypothetical protein [Candidatus Delongbacteria bacterium]
MARLGLNNIKTCSQINNTATDKYKKYMQIGCLEMEKARRQKVKESAVAQLKKINERISELDFKINDCLKCIENKEMDNLGKKQSTDNSGGFKIRY